MNPHRKRLVSLLGSLAHSRHTWDVFRDFVELAAITLASVDLAKRAEREKRYLQVAKAYSTEQMRVFPEIFGELVLALELEPADVLGQVFMELGLGGRWAGQFFTPEAVCDVMARMTLDAGEARRKVKEQGYMTLSEPAIGGGAMVIAFCKAMREAKLNYQRHLHVTAVDVDITAVHMSFVQLSLLHVPATIVHGNALTLEQRSAWYTPAHVFGAWSLRLRARPAPAPAALAVEADERRAA